MILLHQCQRCQFRSFATTIFTLAAATLLSHTKNDRPDNSQSLPSLVRSPQIFPLLPRGRDAGYSLRLAICWVLTRQQHALLSARHGFVLHLFCALHLACASSPHCLVFSTLLAALCLTCASPPCWHSSTLLALLHLAGAFPRCWCFFTWLAVLHLAVWHFSTWLELLHLAGVLHLAGASPPGCLALLHLAVWCSSTWLLQRCHNLR